MTTIRVTKVILDVDMRKCRWLVFGDHHSLKGLARGQVVLLLNRACTMARFVDCERTIHTMYCDEGESFDVPTIETMVRERTLAIGVDVVRNRNVQPKRVVGVSMPERKVATG
jgi:hypothetical protein